MNVYTADLLETIRRTSPLIHNITNYVVMNSSANILLAAGASPVMAHCQAEVEEMVSFAGALVLNIGTLQEDWVASMILAAKAANQKGIPVVLDPVGSGATRLRTEAVKRILRESRVTVLRGNASEIFSLQSADVKTKGVDSSLDFSDEMIEAAKAMASDLQCVVAISGAVDCITDGARVFRVANGHPLMTKVTGMGCGLSSIVGAFCAVDPSDPAKATAAAFGYYGLCGDLAVKVSDTPGSFAVAFVDQLYMVGRSEITQLLKLKQSA
ncbi:MAG: hydroxyethylthiazole kinase [Oxalobacter sp.]|nr:MAG: hydroxyethylthiazole kinase [Oxalobacter sp.]